MRMRKLFEKVEESVDSHLTVKEESKVRQVIDSFEILMKSGSPKTDRGSIPKKKTVKRLEKKSVRQTNTLDSWVRGRVENGESKTESRTVNAEQLVKTSERRRATKIAKTKNTIFGQRKSVMEGARSCIEKIQSERNPENPKKLDQTKTKPSTANRHIKMNEMGTILTEPSKCVQKENELKKKVKIWDVFFEERSLNGNKGAKIRNEERARYKKSGGDEPVTKPNQKHVFP